MQHLDAREHEIQHICSQLKADKVKLQTEIDEQAEQLGDMNRRLVSKDTICEGKDRELKRIKADFESAVLKQQADLKQMKEMLQGKEEVLEGMRNKMNSTEER